MSEDLKEKIKTDYEIATAILEHDLKDPYFSARLLAYELGRVDVLKEIVKELEVA